MPFGLIVRSPSPPRRAPHPRRAAPAVVTAVAAVAALGWCAPASAAVDPETAFVFNTLLFLIGGFLVMLMALGFTMLETGFVRSKHAGVICVKNMGLYSIAGLMFYGIGYNLLYGGASPYFGGISIPWAPGPVEIGEDGSSYSSEADWFFQMVFVATAASIVSGTLAERVRIGPFFIFVAILTGLIYPLQGSWGPWAGGWLNADFGYVDFAGSTIVHSTGGWAALAGALLLGARTGRFGPNRVAMPGHSLPLATMGTFILWFGWFGFNGASQLKLGSAADADAVARIFANTNMAAAGGVVAAYACSVFIGRGKVNLSFVLNGALGGLVAITAEPLTPAIWQAILIGALGGVIATYGAIVLERLRIDDVVGAIPVHLFAGIWGTLAVPLTNADATVGGQLMGIAVTGVFVFAVSYAVWAALKATVGIRLSEAAEVVGGDMSELGHESYPEFTPGDGRTAPG